MLQKLYVGIAGNIGTGKSTLTQMLADSWSGNAHFESVKDNPYLEDFYKDMLRWSFQLQIYFLNARFKAHKEINVATGIHIQDRTIYEDANIFAPSLFEAGNMCERDFRNYRSVYASMLEHLTPPDLIVYLKKSVPNLESQIAKRGRDYEKSIPSSYLEALNTHYNAWIESYPGKKLVIESDGLDFVKNSQDYQLIKAKIEAALS